MTIKHFSRYSMLFAAVLCGVLTLSGCDKDKEGSAGRGPSPVSVVKVMRHDVPADMTWVAKTESSRAVEIYSRVNGFLDARKYTEGGMVNAGDILFLMDKKPFEVQLSETQASLDSSLAAHEVAKRNLNRIRPLAKLKALSQTDLDQAIGDFQTTAAAVSNAKAQVENAKLNLSYCTITSPVTGYASSALQTFSMSENEEAKINQEVKEGILRRPENHDYEVQLELAGGEIYPITGRVTFSSPNFNPNTGTFELRASFVNPNNQLRPQQYVRAIVKGATYVNAIVVPQIAVQEGSKGHFVWVVTKDNKAQYRPVEVGSWIGNDWLIKSGLEEGDKVVTEGKMLLASEAPVKIVKEEDQKPSADDKVKK